MAIWDAVRNLIRPQAGTNGSKPPVQTPEAQAPAQPETLEGTAPSGTEAPKPGWVKQMETEAPAKRAAMEAEAVSQIGAMQEGQKDPRLTASSPESGAAGQAQVAKAQHLTQGTWGAAKTQAPQEGSSGESKG